MKKISSLLVFFGIFLFSGLNAQTGEKITTENISKLQDITLTLSSNISTDAFKPDWSANIESWKTKVKSANTYKTIGTSIIQLENYLKPEVFIPEWANFRQSWITKCNNPKFAADLGKALLSLEMNILPAQFNAIWTGIRQAWADKCVSFKN